MLCSVLWTCWPRMVRAVPTAAATAITASVRHMLNNAKPCGDLVCHHSASVRTLIGTICWQFFVLNRSWYSFPSVEIWFPYIGSCRYQIEVNLVVDVIRPLLRVRVSCPFKCFYNGDWKDFQSIKPVLPQRYLQSCSCCWARFNVPPNTL